METEMRRSDRMLGEAETRELLQNGEYGILSTASRAGQPYGIPLNYTYRGNALYFHCAQDGRKIQNLNENNRVSFCVVGQTELLPDKFSTKYESVIVSGQIEEVSGEEKNRALLELLQKYSAGFVEKGMHYIEKAGTKTKVYKLTIDSVTGKSRK